MARALVLLFAAASCAPAVPVAPINAQPPVEAVADPSSPSPAAILARSRSLLEQDALARLGTDVLAEIRSAPASVLMRRMNSLPRMIRQPDGSWAPEPASVVAAVREPAGWVRITADGRAPFEATASAHLDRLLAGPALWAEPIIASAGCTDPSGTNVLIRKAGRERLSNFPCGWVGRAGEVAEIVLAGAIMDWTKVPRELRPEGIPLARFPDDVANRYRFSSGIHEPRRIEIRSAGEWDAQWRRLTARQGNAGPAPFVDFSREMILMAAMGPRPTGGYRVEIERVLPRGGALEAFVRETSPGPRCGTTQAVTSPVDIVRIPVDSRPVRWVIEQDLSDCP